MARAILCDRCGKPVSVAKDGDHFVGDDGAEAADIEILVGGERIAHFSDLCDECSDELSSAIEKVFWGNRPQQAGEPVQDESPERDPDAFIREHMMNGGTS